MLAFLIGFVGAVIGSMFSPLLALGGMAAGWLAHLRPVWALAPLGLAGGIAAALQAARAAPSVYFLAAQLCATLLWAALAYGLLRVIDRARPI